MINKAQKKSFLLATILPHTVSDEEALKDLHELKLLVESYGGEVADLIVQRREIHDKGNYLGTGKVEEAAIVIRQKKIDIVVLNAIVKPGQIHDIKKVLAKSNADIEVWDRADLILQIFSKHAHTAEARLQIELAAMRHMGPRIYGMGMELSRQTGGIGGRGIGETNTERMKRHWREQMKKVQDKLSKLSADKERQLERRRKVGLTTISIIGYTNAGKTTLFNYLTGKHKLAENALFATLDSSVGKLYLPRLQKEVLLSDTIGFIKKLPTELIDAFKSTLMESIHADVLMHVIDVSDEQMHKKIAIVENILQDLGLEEKKRLYVFTKMDKAPVEIVEEIKNRYELFLPQFVSTKTGSGINTLLTIIENSIENVE